MLKNRIEMIRGFSDLNKDEEKEPGQREYYTGGASRYVYILYVLFISFIIVLTNFHYVSVVRL